MRKRLTMGGGNLYHKLMQKIFPLFVYEVTSTDKTAKYGINPIKKTYVNLSAFIPARKKLVVLLMLFVVVAMPIQIYSKEWTTFSMDNTRSCTDKDDKLFVSNSYSWIKELPADAKMPVFNKSMVIVPAAGGLYIYGKATGEKITNLSLSQGAKIQAPTVAAIGDYVYFTTTGGILSRLDTKTGNIKSVQYSGYDFKESLPAIVKTENITTIYGGLGQGVFICDGELESTRYVDLYAQYDCPDQHGKTIISIGNNNRFALNSENSGWFEPSTNINNYGSLDTFLSLPTYTGEVNQFPWGHINEPDPGQNEYNFWNMYLCYHVSHKPVASVEGDNAWVASDFLFANYRGASESALVRMSINTGVIQSWKKVPGWFISYQMLCSDKGYAYFPLKALTPDATGIYCYDSDCNVKWFKKAILPANANMVKTRNFYVPGEDTPREAILVTMGLSSAQGGDGNIKTAYALDAATGNVLWHTEDTVQPSANAFIQISDGTLYYSDGHTLRQYQGSDIGYSIKNSQDITESGANMFTGNVIRSVTDAEIPGKGLSFRLVRTYNSHSKETGIIGRGWSFNYDMKLTRNGFDSQTDITNLTLARGDGRRIIYNKVDGVFMPPSWENSTLTDHGDGTYKLTERNGLVYTLYGFKQNFSDQDYCRNGKLKEIKDIYGNTMSFEYDGAGQISKITDSAGRYILFTFESGSLKTVTLPDGGKIQYEYFQDQLTGVNGPGDIEASYSYNQYDMLKSYSEPRLPAGEKKKSYEYDDNKRVSRVSNSSMQTLEKYYYYPKEAKSIREDAKGNQWIEYYNTNGQIIKVENPNGDSIRYWWSGYNKTAIQDEMGHRTSFTYDEHNQKTSMTNAENETENYTYDERGNVLTSTDGSGRTTTYTYDKNSLLTIVNNKNETIETNQYNSDGTLKKKIDGENNVIEYNYDSYGNIDWVKDQNMATEDSTYDNMGRLTKVIDKRGKETEYTYWPEGKVKTMTKKSTDLGNFVKSYAYDNMQNLTSATAPDGSFTYTYDDNDRVLTVTDAMGHISQNTYDVNGNLATVTDPNNKTVVYSYDDLNRQESARFPDGGTITKTYYPDGKIQRINKPEGGYIAYEYDAAGRETKMEFPQKNVTKAYDDAGRLVSVTQGGITQINEYDEAGRMNKTRYGNKELSYEYYINGLVKKASRNWDMETEKEVDYQYYPNGLLKQADAIGQTSVETRKFEYDNNGNRTKSEIGRGTNSDFMVYEYDDFGRVKKVIDSDDEEFIYGYNLSGTRAYLIYPNGTKIEYADYDAINRLGSIKYLKNNPLQAPVILDSVSFTYDNLNNIVQKSTLTETENYTYDNNNRLIGIEYQKSGETNSYTYDKNGRRESVTDINGTKTYSYIGNGDERLTNDGTNTYAYDAQGNVSRKGSDIYYHNDLNLLTGVSGPGKQVTYNYDIENRLKKRNDQVNSNKSIYLYEGRDIIGEIEVSSNLMEQIASIYIRGINGEMLKEKRYSTDEFGNRTETKLYYYPDKTGSVYMICDEKGMVLEREIFDVFGKNKNGGLSKFGISSNMFDTITGLYYFAARWYDPVTGRFIEMDPVIAEQGIINMYDYCNNNAINLTDRYGEDWFEDIFGVTWQDFYDYNYKKEWLVKWERSKSKCEDKTLSEENAVELTENVGEIMADTARQSLTGATAGKLLSKPLAGAARNLRCVPALGIIVSAGFAFKDYNDQIDTVNKSNLTDEQKQFLYDRIACESKWEYLGSLGGGGLVAVCTPLTGGWALLAGGVAGWSGGIVVKSAAVFLFDITH